VLLTPRELQIARLVCGGHSNHSIGVSLGLSHYTVAGHLHRSYRKLGLTHKDQPRVALAVHYVRRDSLTLALAE
jgi:DNA-binding CsgD family transcriptional regulator